jgi:ferredoxin
VVWGGEGDGAARAGGNRRVCAVCGAGGRCSRCVCVCAVGGLQSATMVSKGSRPSLYRSAWVIDRTEIVCCRLVNKPNTSKKSWHSSM